jgi:hypothetical protein
MMAKKKAANPKRPAASRKSPSRPAAATDPEISAELVEVAVLLLVRHRDAVTARARLAGEHGLEAAIAEATVAEARRRLTLAAGADRVEELGRAIQRLNDLYERSWKAIAADETPAAAAFTSAANIQKELNRLLDLYRPADLPGQQTSQESAELQLIRDYLEPFEFGDDSLPASELVRLAVCRLAG